MPFNQQQYNQALQAGYNDAQILDYLAQENMGVNVEQLQQAREAGHLDQAIVNYLMGGAEQISPQPSESGFWNQLSGTFVDTVRQSNPELLGWAAEGLGTVSGIDTVSDWGAYLQKEFKDNPSEDFVPRISSYKQVEDLETLLDYAGQGIGQAAGSFVIPVAGAAALGTVGAVAPVPGGAAIGGIAGAASGSFALNYGETFKFLVEEEKVDRELAAKIAVVPGALMAGLDTLGLTKLAKPLASLTGKKIAKNIVKRAIQLGGRGYTIEALTEATQDIIKNITGEITEATGASPEDIQLAQRFESVVNSFLIGGFGGGAISTVASPFVSPTEEVSKVLPDVTEGLPETLEEESAGAEDTLTTAQDTAAGDAVAAAEVAADEAQTIKETIEVPPVTEDFEEVSIDEEVDKTVPPSVTVEEPAGLTQEAADFSTELVSGSPELQGSSLETVAVSPETLEDILYVDPTGQPIEEVPDVTAIKEAAQNIAPKQSYPPHIIKKILENLKRRFAARGFSDDVALVLTDTLARREIGTGGEAAASDEAKYVLRTNAAKGAILLALDVLPQSTLKKPKEMASYLAGLADHETVHAWVDLGVINDKDMNALAKAATIAPHWSDPNKTVMEVIQETYGDLDETGQIEEAAAELFRGHASNNVVLKGRPLSIWQRILNFFRSLKGGLADADIYKASQVFERIQVAPDWVGAPVRVEDFAEEIVPHVKKKVEEEQDEKAARIFHGGAVMWKPEVGRVLGTPDLSFIGTGEGHATFGWGFYGGQALGTGREYRRNISYNRMEALLSRLPDYFAPGRIVPSYSGRDKVLGFNPPDENTGQDWSVDVIAVDREGNPIPGAKPRQHSTMPDPKLLDSEVEPLGIMYELDVPDDAVAKFLDWDTLLVEQSPAIQRIAEDLLVDHALSTGVRADTMSIEDWTGERLYRSLSNTLRSRGKIGDMNQREADKLASETLRDAGIPGLQFFDMGSRNLGAVTGRTLVVRGREIDTKDIDILSAPSESFAVNRLLETNMDFEAAKRIARGMGQDEVVEVIDDWSRTPDEIQIKDTRTRNFVIWDQDVLDRTEVVGINEVPFNQVAVNLSSATGTIPGLADLQEQANTGDIEAQQVLQDVASDSLSYLLSGIGLHYGEPEVRILSTPAQGLYFGDLEPSIGLDVGFQQEDKRYVLAALAKFADNFNQEQIHVRTKPDPDTDVSFVYPDGSFNTASVRFNLKEPLSREEVEKVISSSGLAGMTATDTYLDAYYIGDPTDANAIQEFRQGAGRASQSLEGRTSGIDAGVQRLWAYGEGYGATNPYSDISGPLRPPDAEEGNRTSWRIAQRLRGRPFIPVPSQQSLTPAQRDLQSDIADAFDDMPLNDLGNPQVRKAYDELARELKSQYRALPVKVEVWNQYRVGQPYADSDAMRKDVRENNHLYIYGTEEATFGPPGAVYDNHPLLRPSPFNDINGEPLLVNDLLRAVHDYYAHTMEPNKFGPLGEEAAWQNHMRMTRSPWARWALTSETRGQNSWVNFHRLGIAPDKRADTLPITEREYSEQKTALLPIQYTMTGDPVLDQEMIELVGDIVPPIETELQNQFSAATSTDKDARHFTQLPAAAKKLVVANPQDPPNYLTNRFGTIRHNGKDIPVALHVGTPQDSGLLHAEEHLEEFKQFTPYDTIPKALKSFLTAYWNPELQAPRKGYAVYEGRSRGQRDYVTLDWNDPASKYPIRAVFYLLDPYDVKGIGQPLFLMQTIFPVSGRERPDYIQAKKKMEADKSYQLKKLSPEGRAAAIETLMKGKKTKAARPISKEFSLKDKPMDMGVDIPSGIVMPQQDETLGQKFLKNLGMLGGRPIDSFGQFFRWFRTAHVDMWDPGRVSDVTLAEKDPSKFSSFLSASSSAWAALRMARRGTAITAYALSKGVPVYEKGGTTVKDIPEDAQQTNIDGTTERSRIAGTSTGFIPIIAPLRKGNRFDVFHLYSIARRAARLIREGRERLLTQQQIAEYLALGNTVPEIAQIMQIQEADVATLLDRKKIVYNADFSDIFQDYQVWNSYFVDFLVDTGVLTREKADIWKETADYIPFYRQLDRTDQGIAGETDMFAETVGGKRVPITAASPPPPLSGKGTIWGIVTTDANNVSTILPTTFRSHEKKVAEGYAKKFEKETGVKTKVESMGMPIGGFLDTLTENALSAVQTGMMNVGVQRAMRNLVLIDPETTVRAKPGTPNTVTFRVKGKSVTLYVGDKELYASLQSYLVNQQIPPWVNLLGMPARFLREMITRSPDFMAANMLRDSLSAWVTSGRNTGALAGTIGGFVQALRGSTSADALAAAGLMTGFDFGGDPSKMTKFIETELVKYKYPSAAVRFMRNPLKGIWDATGTASRASDAATRIAVYERVLKETGDEVQAIFEAQEVINFSARGSSALIQQLAIMVPFLNARIQGLDVLYRSSMGRKGFASRPESDIVKRRFYMRALLVGMSSAAYWALVHDDEEYINQNPEIKDNYWIIPSSWIPGYDGPPLKIPIPFEVGFLFKTIPERVMALYFGKDVPRDITRSMRQGFINTFEFLPIPQAVLPLGEAITNYSVWTGRKIEGQYIADGLPGYRANSRTSALAMKMGEAVNYSPIMIDHMIRGYSGTLGTVLLDTVDSVIRDTASDLGERPAKQLSQYPFVKRFFARPDARGLITQFYDLKEAVDQAVNSVKRLEEGELTFLKGQDLRDEMASLIMMKDEVKVIEGVLSDLRKQRAILMKSDKSAEQKRLELDEISAMELMVVESIPEMRQEAFQ